MKRSHVVALRTGLLVVLVSATLSSQQTRPTLRIGVVFDGPWERNTELVALMKKEISDALSGQTVVLFPEDKVLIGDWTVSSSARLNTKLIDDPNIDLVIGFGVFTSQDLCSRSSLAKPVIAPVIIDPQRQRLPLQSGTSGVKNLSYLVFPQTFLRDYEFFRELVPFRKLVFLTSKRYHEGVPATRPSDKEISKRTGVEFVTVRFDEKAEEALAAIPKDAGAVYLDIVPIAHREFDKLVDGFIERRLPSFSMLGETEVRKGIMAAANPDIFPRLIRRIALNIHRIVLGENAGTLPISFPAGKRMFVNLKTAFAVGVSPKWNTLLEAEVIQLDSTAERGAERYTLASALRRILDANLDVSAKIREATAGSGNITIARANLLPKIDFSANGFQIDDDRAQAGMQPVKRATADIGLTQVIFSEPALANLSIQSSLQDSREHDLEITKLNAVADGSGLYLNYLRARKTYSALLENLKLTRSNLELAQIREATGAAGPEEVLRWKVEIANLRTSVMGLHSQMNQLLLALKQVMNIPLIYVIAINDVSLDDPTLFLSNKQFLEYLEDPVSFDVLTDIVAQEGLAKSREIQQLDALIAARERGLSSLRNSLFMPTIAAYANYSNTFYKSNVGSLYQMANIPAPPASLPAELPLYLGQLFTAISPQLPDRNDWNVGLQLSFNLFNGFSTNAQVDQSRDAVQQIQIQRKAVEEKVALRIRLQMEKVKAAHFAIQQSRLEQDAARRGLEIVSDAYSRGAVPILNLLDAQNSTLRADNVSANTLYDFFVEYFQLERAVGQFDILMTPAERDQVLNRILDGMKRALKK